MSSSNVDAVYGLSSFVSTFWTYFSQICANNVKWPYEKYDTDAEEEIAYKRQETQNGKSLTVALILELDNQTFIQNATQDDFDNAVTAIRNSSLSSNLDLINNFYDFIKQLIKGKEELYIIINGQKQYINELISSKIAFNKFINAIKK